VGKTGHLATKLTVFDQNLALFATLDSFWSKISVHGQFFKIKSGQKISQFFR